jgi:hypothetical protein
VTDNLDPETQQQARDMALAAEIEFASNYKIFTETPQGRVILDHWARNINGRAMPAHASHGEMAFANGMRSLVLGFRDQIEKAGASPPPSADNPFA